MKKKLPEIILRGSSGIVYIGVIVLLILLNNIIFSIALTVLASMIILWEYFSCTDLKLSPYMIFGFILTIALGVLLFIFKEKVFDYLFISFAIIFIITVIIGLLSSERYSFNSIPIAIFGYIYTIGLPLFLIKMFFLEQGNIKFTLLITIVVATDTFAFLVGKKFGKNKLTKISPNKTIEGSLAGIVSAVIFSMIYTAIVNTYYDFNLNYYIMFIVSTFLSVVSQLGDLLASYTKRAYNVKDFGNLLPGQGGLLDRVDSLIFAAPMAYLLIKILM